MPRAGRRTKQNQAKGVSAPSSSTPRARAAPEGHVAGVAVPGAPALPLLALEDAPTHSQCARAPPPAMPALPVNSKPLASPTTTSKDGSNPPVKRHRLDNVLYASASVNPERLRLMDVAKSLPTEMLGQAKFFLGIYLVLNDELL